MNLSSVASVPEMSSINAFLFAPNSTPGTPLRFDSGISGDTTDNRGGVRQDPPGRIFGGRHEVETSEGDSDVDLEPTDSEGE